MTRRVPSAALCAGVLLGALSLAARAAAKPPDLPLSQKDTLAPSPGEGASDCISSPGAFTDGTLLGTAEVKETDTGSLLFGVGVNRNSGLTGSIVFKGCDADDFGAADEAQEEALLEADKLAIFSLLVGRPYVWTSIDNGDSVVWTYRRSNRPSSVVPLCPLSAVYRLRPTARQHFASGLLFGINPLLMLVPTEKLFDTPEDHPPRKKAEGIAPTSLIARGQAPPSPPPPPAPSVCPWLARRTVEQHAQRIDDLDLPRDVLANLERLLEADRLMATARELARAGYVWEALECYDIVYRLCPGSSFEDRVCQAVADLFAQCADGSEEAEPDEEGPDVEAKPGAEEALSWWETGTWLTELVKKLREECSVNLPHDVCVEVGACPHGLRVLCRVPWNGSLFHLSYDPGGFDAWVTLDGGSR